ncbi:MAG: CU044_2847 family protein [Blastocatellia bacterium]
MATKLLKFQTEAGEVLIAAPAPQSMVKATGRLEDTIEAVGNTLAQALSIVAGVSQSFQHVFAETGADTAELELGLQCTAKGSVYVVETTGNAALKVKLSFKRKE